MKKSNIPQMRKVVSKYGASAKPLPRGVRELDKVSFIALYNMYAESKFDLDDRKAVGVLRGERLKEIFRFVRYEPSENQLKAIDQHIKKNLGKLTFEQFLEIFDLKADACFDKSEVMRVFCLFSKEYELNNVIKVSRVEEVLVEMELMMVASGEHMDIDIAELIVLLKSKEKNGYVNYKEFVDEAFGPY